MKSIVALMITGVLASATALADQPMTVAQAPAATSPSGASPTGDQPAKKQAHHRKKTKKTTMATAPTDTKKSGAKPATEMAKPATPPSDMKK